jgi:hypothetical protein
MGLVLATVAACAPDYRGSEQVASEPPEVTYDYSTDDGLLEVSSKARAYCGQLPVTGWRQVRKPAWSWVPPRCAG